MASTFNTLDSRHTQSSDASRTGQAGGQNVATSDQSYNLLDWENLAKRVAILDERVRLVEGTGRTNESRLEHNPDRGRPQNAKRGGKRRRQESPVSREPITKRRAFDCAKEWSYAGDRENDTGTVSMLWPSSQTRIAPFPKTMSLPPPSDPATASQNASTDRVSHVIRRGGTEQVEADYCWWLGWFGRHPYQLTQEHLSKLEGKSSQSWIGRQIATNLKLLIGPINAATYHADHPGASSVKKGDSKVDLPGLSSIARRKRDGTLRPPPDWTPPDSMPGPLTAEQISSLMATWARKNAGPAFTAAVQLDKGPVQQQTTRGNREKRSRERLDDASDAHNDGPAFKAQKTQHRPETAAAVRETSAALSQEQPPVRVLSMPEFGTAEFSQWLADPSRSGLELPCPPRGGPEFVRWLEDPWVGMSEQDRMGAEAFFMRHPLV